MHLRGQRNKNNSDIGWSCSGKTTTTKKLAELITAAEDIRIHQLRRFLQKQRGQCYLPDGTKDIEIHQRLEIGLIKECF
jgi:uridine kinase